MRVLHYFRTYLPDSFGGTERMIEALSSGLQAHDIECRVLSLQRANNDNLDSAAVEHTEKAPYRFRIAGMEISFAAIGRLRMMSRDADIIHYHHPWPFADISHYSAMIAKPYVVTYHADIVGRVLLRTLYSPIQKKFLRSAARVVATSPAYARTSPVLSRLVAAPEIIPIGLADVANKLDPAAVAKWKARLPSRFFLFTGVFRYYKGLRFLLEASEKTGADIVLLGNGPERPRLQQLHERLSTSARGRVHFVGELPDRDKYALLHLCAALVFPSDLRAEALGLAMIEAAIFARPAICCEIGTGTTFVNLHEKTGLSVPPADPEALAAAMNRLSENPQTARSMGMAARERYEEIFSRERMADQYARLYREIVRAPTD